MGLECGKGDVRLWEKGLKDGVWCGVVQGVTWTVILSA